MSLEIAEMHRNFTSSFVTFAWDYLQKVNKVPGLKCEDAACSTGRDVRESDRLKIF